MCLRAQPEDEGVVAVAVEVEEGGAMEVEDEVADK